MGSTTEVVASIYVRIGDPDGLAVERSEVLEADEAGTGSTHRVLITTEVAARVGWSGIMRRHRFLVFTSQSPLR